MDLGIHLDLDLSMQMHVAWTLSSCFAVLRHITARAVLSVNHFNSHLLCHWLCHVWITATLARLHAHLLGRLQPVLNAAARLVFGSSKYDHRTPLLHDSHWQRNPKRITFRLVVLVYRCHYGLVQPYLADELQCVADIESRQRVQSASTTVLVVSSSIHSTTGGRTSSVAAARIWHGLPQ